MEDGGVERAFSEGCLVDQGCVLSELHPYCICIKVMNYVRRIMRCIAIRFSKLLPDRSSLPDCPLEAGGVTSTKIASFLKRAAGFGPLLGLQVCLKSVISVVSTSIEIMIR